MTGSWVVVFAYVDVDATCLYKCIMNIHNKMKVLEVRSAYYIVPRRANVNEPAIVSG